MFPAASLLTALLLAVSTVASPVDSEVRTSPVTLPFAKFINTGGGAINLVQHDQARDAALKERAIAIQNGKLDHRDTGSLDLTNLACAYIASVGVGDPATSYDMMVYTGFSSTVLEGYKVTKSSVDTKQRLAPPCPSGEQWLDTVTLSPELVIAQQSIAALDFSGAMPLGIDGAPGIGPADLSVGCLSSEPGTATPTVTDSLYSQGTISENIVSMSFEPSITGNDTNDELTFGGTDPTRYTGSISYRQGTYALTPNAQIWPRALNAVIDDTSDGIYLIVSNLGPFPTQGIDFTIGKAFLERFYTIFDTTNKRIGFATTD